MAIEEGESQEVKRRTGEEVTVMSSPLHFLTSSFLHLLTSCPLSPTIIRRFLRNGNIMWMTLLETCTCNLNKARFL